MKLWSSIENLPDHCRHAVIAIGNFDGVHHGHLALIDAARREASWQGGMTAGILTFEPHPRALFRPDDPPFRITPFPLKMRLLEATGVDYVCCLPFDWNFASQSAEDFIAHILDKGLAPAHIIVGEDFRFGQLRKGSAETLRQAGYEVTVIKPVAAPDGTVYSSSMIREALRKGDIDTANRLLGYDWEIEGVIESGDKRGRELGYPTANVALGQTLHPGYGVYATMVQIVEDGPEAPWLPAATNIGIRPMFELKVGRAEAHILDFDRDIYGKTLRIRPVKRLRGEARFDSLEALIAQIDSDCRQTRRVLSTEGAATGKS